MKQVIDHLIKDHGYTKIAYIRGPEKHVAANQRFKAYVECLKENNIPYNGRLLTFKEELL